MSRLIVYIDGECPMCREGAQQLEKFDTNDALRFVDLHDESWAERAAERFTPSDLFDIMRVEMPDGTWRSGYFAWGAVLERLPTWRGLGLLMRFPLFYGIGPSIYRWVADHRLLVSRLLRLPEPCDANGACRIHA
jgi:predicted DCC family thiol-disulfide oxidoreductase YuxK